MFAAGPSFFTCAHAAAAAAIVTDMVVSCTSESFKTVVNLHFCVLLVGLQHSWSFFCFHSLAESFISVFLFFSPSFCQFCSGRFSSIAHHWKCLNLPWTDLNNQIYGNRVPIRALPPDFAEIDVGTWIFPECFRIRRWFQHTKGNFHALAAPSSIRVSCWGAALTDKKERERWKKEIENNINHYTATVKETNSMFA